MTTKLKQPSSPSACWISGCKRKAREAQNTCQKHGRLEGAARSLQHRLEKAQERVPDAGKEPVLTPFTIPEPGSSEDWSRPCNLGCGHTQAFHMPVPDGDIGACNYLNCECKVFRWALHPEKEPAPLPKGKFEKLGTEIGQLVDKKNTAYGDSFAKAGDFLKLLYPNGIKPEQYTDMLCLVRIFDKQMRIATAKGAFGEDPFRDIAGYGILGASLKPAPG